MGTANVKAIKTRIKSVDSTKHITRAMQLVAASKVKKAEEKMRRSREYREVFLDAFAAISGEKSIYTEKRDGNLPSLYIVIAGDRGLAGGYNNNVFRMAASVMKNGDYVIPVGKRAVEHFEKRKNLNVLSTLYVSSEHFGGVLASDIAHTAKDLYDEEKIGSVRVISTRFNTMLSQSPVVTSLLPLTDVAEERKTDPETGLIEYEPSAEAVQKRVIAGYITGVIVTLVSEAYASEVAARRAAMDTATKNADEMLENLRLSYNRARQSAITQEITEIVAGAGAGK